MGYELQRFRAYGALNFSLGRKDKQEYVRDGMKSSRSISEASGFTLLELIIVIAIMVILAAFLIPIRSNKSSPGVRCMSNLKHIGLGFMIFAGNYTNKFPMQISVQTGGSMEFIHSDHTFPHFEKIQDFWPRQQGDQFYKTLVCPADKSRQAATNAEGFSDLNISYFINVDAQNLIDPSQVVLAGDRDLKSNNQAVKPGLLTVTTNMDLNWSGELHRSFGNVAFADGHVERIKTNSLVVVFAQQPLVTNRLAIP